MEVTIGVGHNIWIYLQILQRESIYCFCFLMSWNFSPIFHLYGGKVSPGLHSCFETPNWEILGWQALPGDSEVKTSAWNAGDLGSIPGLGRSPGERNGNPLQYSCLENPVEGGAWWATVHGISKSQTRLNDFTFTDAGKDLRQEEKGMTEDKMVWWHYQLDGHEFEQALRVGLGQGSLACCSPWGCKESNTTEWLN